MTEWWLTLSETSRIFWGIAVASGIFQILLFAGSMITGHGLDHTPDAGHAASTASFKFLSVRAIVAFLVGFGWAGVLFTGSGRSTLETLVIAGFAGCVFMGVIYLLMRSLLSLKSDGTLDYTNAIGQTGHVYVTIPAMGGGQGQVEIMIQGRLATASAVTTCDFPLTPQTLILVHDVEGKALLVVAPL